MPYTTIAGERLFYGLYEGNPTRKHNLILAHGAGGDHTHWPAALRRLANFNVYALDLPGHGRSQGKGRTSVDDYADTVELFAGALEVKRASLAGHSMGGAVAQTLALRQPTWLTSVVLIATGARLRVDPLILEGLQTDYELTVETICQRVFGPSTGEQLARKGRRQLRDADPAIVHGDYLACNNFDALERVGDIQLPTLIISGDADQMTPPKYGQYLHQQIKGSELVEIKDAGHMVALEKPRQVAQAVGRFLARVYK